MVEFSRNGLQYRDARAGIQHQLAQRGATTRVGGVKRADMPLHVARGTGAKQRDGRGDVNAGDPVAPPQPKRALAIERGGENTGIGQAFVNHAPAAAIVLQNHRAAAQRSHTDGAIRQQHAVVDFVLSEVVIRFGAKRGYLRAIVEAELSASCGDEHPLVAVRMQEYTNGVFVSLAAWQVSKLVAHDLLQPNAGLRCVEPAAHDRERFKAGLR